MKLTPEHHKGLINGLDTSVCSTGMFTSRPLTRAGEDIVFDRADISLFTYGVGQNAERAGFPYNGCGATEDMTTCGWDGRVTGKRLDYVVTGIAAWFGTLRVNGKNAHWLDRYREQIELALAESVTCQFRERSMGCAYRFGALMAHARGPCGRQLVVDGVVLATCRLTQHNLESEHVDGEMRWTSPAADAFQPLAVAFRVAADSDFSVDLRNQRVVTICNHPVEPTFAGEGVSVPVKVKLIGYPIDPEPTWCCVPQGQFSGMPR